jgi:uncharacterized protein YjbI with pentapeptide repeats
MSKSEDQLRFAQFVASQDDGASHTGKRAMRNASFLAVKYKDASLSKAALSAVEFYDCKFDNINIRRCSLVGGRFNDCSLRNARFNYSYIADYIIDRNNLSGSQFESAHMSAVTFDDCNLAKANFCLTKMIDCAFTNDCKLSNTEFNNASLLNCSLQIDSCHLAATKFECASLADCKVEINAENRTLTNDKFKRLVLTAVRKFSEANIYDTVVEISTGYHSLPIEILEQHSLASNITLTVSPFAVILRGFIVCDYTGKPVTSLEFKLDHMLQGSLAAEDTFRKLVAKNFSPPHSQVLINWWEKYGATAQLLAYHYSRANEELIKLATNIVPPDED